MENKPFTLPLDSNAPNFHLKGIDGKEYSLGDFQDAKVVVIFFTCNHCPYVINSDEVTRQTVEKFKPHGAVFIGINSNSEKSYPEDSFPKMMERMEAHHFPWVYLYDQTQDIAREYGALRTPHFYIFDDKRKLIYTGRGVDYPRDASKITVNDLENALDDYFAGRPIRTTLTNPIGCNIKWEGKENHWIPDDACDLI